MLATDRAHLRDDYDVLIVGSGYGGAITAARLGYANSKSGSKLNIAILERGEEHVTGSFPVNAGEFAGHIRTKNNPMGLFEFVSSPNFFVVQGNGLGGTSLCNGVVCIIPDREVFETYWPEPYRSNSSLLDPYYARALEMMGAVPYAKDEDLPKAAVMQKISQAVGGKFDYLHLAVSKERRTTRFGIPRRPCENCGSCISGCNYEAKNTLDKNYLPMAKYYGVDMFTGMEVDIITPQPDGNGYQLTVNMRDRHDPTRMTPRNITTRRLILAAGCLGTTGILIRSAARKMRFSKHLGEHFSGNGDYFALAYSMDEITNFNGWGKGTPPNLQTKGGPTITTVFRMNGQEPLTQRLTFEEASMPVPFVETMRNITFAASGGQPWALLNNPGKIKRWLEDRYPNTTGATNSTLLYLGMGFDGAKGRIRTHADGSPFVDWPDAVDAEVFKLLEPVTIQGTQALGGTRLPNPVLKFGANPFSVPPDRVAITGHPMGGCATADNVDQGVIDERGRVFHPDGGVYDGLYVFDGSIFPNAIGVNVLLTISAFTERAVELLREEMGLPPFYAGDEARD